MTFFSYWGSYDLTIPGGSGAGNAVEHLSLPDNAPDFFKFAAFDRQTLQAQPVNQPAPKPVQQFRPAPQPAQQFRPAPQPAQQFRPTTQPAQQFRPAPQPAPQAAPVQVQSQFSLQTIIGSAQQQGAGSTQLRVFDSEPSVERTPAQRRPAPQPAQQSRTVPRPTQHVRPAPQPTQQFRPAPQPTQQFRPAPQPTQKFEPFPQPAQQSRPTPQAPKRQQTRPALGQNTAPVATRNYVHDTSGDNQLSRFQLYQVRKKQGQQQNQLPAVQETAKNEVK